MFTLLMWTLFDFGHYSSLGIEDANNHIIPASITDAFVIRPLDSRLYVRKFDLNTSQLIYN